MGLCPMTARPRKAGPVVPADVALNEPPMEMKWLRGKPAQEPITSKAPET